MNKTSGLTKNLSYSSLCSLPFAYTKLFPLLPVEPQRVQKNNTAILVIDYTVEIRIQWCILPVDFQHYSMHVAQKFS